MFTLTIRGVSVVLSVSLMLSTAAVTLSMTLSTANTAVEETEMAGRRAIALSRESGRGNVEGVISDLMKQVLDMIESRVHMHLAPAKDMTDTLAGFMRNHPPDQTKGTAFFNVTAREMVWHAYDIQQRKNPPGVTAISLFQMKEDLPMQMLVYGEQPTTMHNPRGAGPAHGFHMIGGVECLADPNVTMPDGTGSGMDMYSFGVDANGYWNGNPCSDPITDLMLERQPGLCPVDLAALSTESAATAYMQQMWTKYPGGTARWGQIIDVGSTNILLSYYRSWSHPLQAIRPAMPATGNRVGLVIASLDVLSASQIAHHIALQLPREPGDELRSSHLYVVMSGQHEGRTSPASSSSVLFAASHGQVWASDLTKIADGYENTPGSGRVYARIPLRAENSSDAIIQEHSRHVMAQCQQSCGGCGAGMVTDASLPGGAPRSGARARDARAHGRRAEERPQSRRATATCTGCTGLDEGCVDDPDGMLEAGGVNCGTLFALGCDFDLNAMSPQAPPGSLVKKFCPRSCKDCPPLAPPCVDDGLSWEHFGGTAAEGLTTWRSGAGEPWWVSVRAITDAGTALQMHCVLLIPRNAAMKTIDMATRQVDDEIAHDLSKVEGQRASGFRDMMVTLAVVAVALLFVAVVYPILVTRPLQGLREDMMRCASMELELANVTVPLSLLSEVREMQEGFRLLVKELKVYRAFMPQACLPGGGLDEVDSELDDFDDELGGSGMRMLGGSRLFRPSQGRSQGHSRGESGSRAPTPGGPDDRAVTNASAGVYPVDTSQSWPRRGPTESDAGPALSPRSDGARPSDRKMNVLLSGNTHQSLSQGVQQGLKKKQATLVSANLCGYMLLLRQCPPQAVAVFHSLLLTSMLGFAAKSSAIADGICGDRFYASLNGARRTWGHRARGARLAWALANLKPGSSPPQGSQMSPSAGRRSPVPRGDPAEPSLETVAADVVREARISITVGVASGDLLCGVIGCAGLKAFSLLGTAATWARVQERVAAGHGGAGHGGAAVIVNGLVHDDTQSEFVFRLRTAAVLAKPGHKGLMPQTLWEMISTYDQPMNHDEWLYEMEKLEACNPWSLYNEARKAFHQQNYEMAEGIIATAHARTAVPEVAAKFMAGLTAELRSVQSDENTALSCSEPIAKIEEVHVARWWAKPVSTECHATFSGPPLAVEKQRSWQEAAIASYKQQEAGLEQHRAADRAAQQRDLQCRIDQRKGARGDRDPPARGSSGPRPAPDAVNENTHPAPDAVAGSVPATLAASPSLAACLRREAGARPASQISANGSPHGPGSGATKPCSPGSGGSPRQSPGAAPKCGAKVVDLF